MADIDGDSKFELIVGNERGGLGLYNTNLKTDGGFTTAVSSPAWTQERINVYPNPASKTLTVQFNGNRQVPISILIMDIYGKIHLRQSHSLDNIEIPLDGLAKGVYFMKLLSDAGLVTKKFIKH